MRKVGSLGVVAVTLILGAARGSYAVDADIQIEAAQIHGYGLFTTTSTRRHSGFTQKRMATDAVTGVQFVDFTYDVPPIEGTNFGFEYSINTTPRGQKMRVKSIIRFPEPGLVSPRGKVYKESIEHKEIKVGTKALHGYGFDETWEIVPGEWVFEVWYKKARIIRKTFTVEAPGVASAINAGE